MRWNARLLNVCVLCMEVVSEWSDFRCTFQSKINYIADNLYEKMHKFSFCVIRQ